MRMSKKEQLELLILLSSACAKRTLGDDEAATRNIDEAIAKINDAEIDEPLPTERTRVG